MTIGEVGRQSGLAPSAIRFYEKAGLLRAPFRKSGRRAYTPDVVHQLALIRFAKDVGFTLPQIRLLLQGFPQNTAASTRWRALAKGKIKELDEVIGKVQAMKTLLESMAIKCQCRTLEECARCLATCGKAKRVPTGAKNSTGTDP
jgi:MerR family transcriptional regulator, redox-sensitive transcriptional activator SoxR